MNRRRIGIIAGVLAGALVVAGFGVWWFLLRSDAPEAVTLEGAVASVTSSTTTTSAQSTSSAPPTAQPGVATTQPPASSTTAAATGSSAPVAGLEGTWELAADGGSFAGYRVQEELGTIGLTTAVGRSTAVTGTLIIEDDIVTVVDVLVDMTALRSDDSRRDGAIRRQALETDTFPQASFALTQPISLPAGASAGAPFAVDAVGELTLHGVTRPVVVPLEAQLVEGSAVVVGSLPVLFEDYAIEQPRAAILLSVDDEGVMEFQLVFERA